MSRREFELSIARECIATHLAKVYCEYIYNESKKDCKNQSLTDSYRKKVEIYVNTRNDPEFATISIRGFMKMFQDSNIDISFNETIAKFCDLMMIEEMRRNLHTDLLRGPMVVILARLVERSSIVILSQYHHQIIDNHASCANAVQDAMLVVIDEEREYQKNEYWNARARSMNIDVVSVEVLNMVRNEVKKLNMEKMELQKKIQSMELVIRNRHQEYEKLIGKVKLLEKENSYLKRHDMIAVPTTNGQDMSYMGNYPSNQSVKVSTSTPKVQVIPNTPAKASTPFSIRDYGPGIFTPTPKTSTEQDVVELIQMDDKEIMRKRIELAKQSMEVKYSSPIVASVQSYPNTSNISPIRQSSHTNTNTNTEEKVEMDSDNIESLIQATSTRRGRNLGNMVDDDF